MRHILDQLSGELDFELIRLVNEDSKSLISGMDDSVVTYRKWSPATTPLKRLLARVGARLHTTNRSLPQVLRDEAIDLVWFLAPNQVIEQVRDVPFVMTVWDLAHREVQGFPEFNSGRGWSRRESWYTNNAGRAFHVVTDSTHTGKALERIYGLYPHNWSAVGLPYPPKVEIDDTKSNEVFAPYFYYPASFWPHKNHKVLVDAMNFLADKEVCLVFTGTDEGVEEPLKQYVSARGLNDRVKFLGRVTDSEVQGLIAGSRGVLMPSYLGPTNYPPLEALRLGVPSVVSSAHHFDDVPKGLLVTIPPHDPERWAEEMNQILFEPRDVKPILDDNESSRAKVRDILMNFQTMRNSYNWN